MTFGGLVGTITAPRNTLGANRADNDGADDSTSAIDPQRPGTSTNHVVMGDAYGFGPQNIRISEQATFGPTLSYFRWVCAVLRTPAHPTIPTMLAHT